ncbi:phage tail protein I [Oceanospirillum sediminis]|uniref:Phage tail protein I n=1 Tax=Oceanospirillum sediminis TaxID=2760088 RepID=A0A839IX64_9GAMM|nr:phage tail protein I [Oceanospirillum sediminis]MBB1489382.1 phage tail protein I [Oceanospirillum sediminis]
MSTESLLPDNRTTLEKALEQTLSDHLLALDCPYPQLWDPYSVPEHMLPYLAHAKGVTDWGGEINTDAKRHTVASIWPVQRLAGTAKGVADAVAGLGLTAEFIPGYSWGGPAYTFRVDLIGGLNGLSADRVQHRIEAAKAERDGYSIRLVYQPVQDLKLGAVVHQSSGARVNYRPPEQTVSPATVYRGGVVYQSSGARVNYRPPEQTVSPATVHRGGVVHQSSGARVNYRPPEQTFSQTQRCLAGVVHQSPQVAVNYQPPEQRLSRTPLYQGRVLHMTRNIIIHR